MVNLQKKIFAIIEIIQTEASLWYFKKNLAYCVSDYLLLKQEKITS